MALEVNGINKETESILPSADSKDKPADTVLRQEIETLRQELASLKGVLSGFSDIFKTKQQENPTQSVYSLPQSNISSTGNEGVPTNKQTDNLPANASKDMLMLVESLKSDLKIKFRNLTKQEFKVFSAIYVLEEQGPVDYKGLASSLGLTESSIRDYIMKMERKGIPVEKVRINNKKILLRVREELRHILSLDNLMRIREPVFR